MRLIEAAGIVATVPDATDEVLDLLMRAALDFVRAGGRVTMTEWCDLSGSERAALSRAGDVVACERAIQDAVAHTGPDGIAAVAALIDGGDARRALLVARAAEMAGKAAAGAVVR